MLSSFSVSAKALDYVQSMSNKATTYTDKEAGVTFTVPANWEKEAFTADQELSGL